jgi:methyltransferase, FkbM family
MRSAKDILLLLLIRAIRSYTHYTPFQRGRFRLTSLLYQVTKQLSRECRLVITARDGRKFSLNPSDPQYHMGLLDRGVFEFEETQVVMDSVQPGHVAIDAGANYGWYTTLLSRLVGPAGTVHAFEAMPFTTEVLRQNCTLNGCDNVFINQCALGDHVGTVAVYDHPGGASGDASLFPIGQGDEHPFTCQMQTLDNYFVQKGLSRCDFIKCDIEGAELLFLKGARNVLKQHQPTILLEINPWVLQRSGTDGVEVLEEIKQYGKYVFFNAAGNRFKSIQPSDCKGLQSYINVLCEAQ